MSLEIENGVLKSCRRDPSFVCLPPSVKIIGKNAFQNHTNLKSILLPDTIKEIREQAFAGCKNLKYIMFSRKLERIGYKAFADCRNLKQILLPKHVTVISAYAFSGCEKLSEIRLPSGLVRIGDSAFLHTPWLETQMKHHEFVIFNRILIACRAEGDVIIPDEVEYIADGAFEDCKNLRSVAFPDGVLHSGTLFSNASNQPETISLYGIRLSWNRIRDMRPSRIFRVMEERNFISQGCYDGKYVYLPPYRADDGYLIWRLFCHHQEDPELKGYIRQYFIESFQYLMEENNISMLEQLLKEESFVTADNIDRLIQTAIEQKHYEIQILLMDYKAKHISAQTTAEIIRNKFYL